MMPLAQVNAQKRAIEQEKIKAYGKKSDRKAFFEELKEKRPEIALAIKDHCQTKASSPKRKRF